ncbi:hypothetical protein V6237_10255 [Pseudoalteromonas carrageenovora]|uniref:hypothetical protein n=1 Tax=Pseudoalteromonas carrageenovora TaxID=227 RepID=UPI00311EFFA0
MKKAAIVQFEAVHEEVIPSIDFYLKSVGYNTGSYLNRNIYKRKGDFFRDAGFEKVNYSYVTIEKGSDWAELMETVKGDEGLELLVLNTFQRKSVVNWSLNFDIPVIGIVHNPLLFLAIPDIKNILKANKNIYLLGLAPHVASYLIANIPFMQDRVGFVDPIVWEDSSREDKIRVIDEGNTKRALSIPGSVNFKNRDYAALIEQVHLAKLRGMSSKNIGIRFLGGGKDRADLIDLIQDKGVNEFFDFSEVNEQGFVPYDIYLSDLKNSSFLLPMFKTSDIAYRTYKISSVISSAVGNSIPLLGDSWTNIVYQTSGVVYNTNLLSDKLLEISLLSEEAYLKLCNQAKETKYNWIKRSIAQLEQATSYFESKD